MQNHHKTAAKKLGTSRQHLITQMLAGKAPDFQMQHAALLDDYFIESFADSMVGPRMNLCKKPYAIIALGGYGRQEQCVHSDVDLLFLFQKAVPKEAEELIREMIYPLWDLGLEVGHATRSIRESISLAATDLDVFTALLDARFICGMSPLYTDLQERLMARIVQGRSKKMITALIENNHQRHERFGDSSYRLEPNLKEGQGCLRDYHTILWIARMTTRLKTPRDLEYHGLLSNFEYEKLRNALDFIWKVRNHLHAATGRKSDQLHFEYQQKIARTLKFKDKGGQLAVEVFLGKLHGLMDYIKQRNLIYLAEIGYGKRSLKSRLIAEKQSRVGGLSVDRAMLNFTSPEHLLASPDLLLKLFAESVRLKIPISSEARRIVTEFGYLVDSRFRKRKSNAAIFEQILVTPAIPFNALNEMLHTGFLVRYIPEMKRIVNRIQFDRYHLFPVDRHSLQTVKTMKSFALPDNENSGGPLCRKLYIELRNYRKLMLWAALLHDIGKGEDGKGHAERGAVVAGDIAKRCGYAPGEIDTVSFLIRNHLLLIKTATRRDVNDEETAIYCARRIKTPRRLKMLYLLTVADSISTGPKAWNDWSAALLRDLFFKVLNVLDHGELATREAVEEVKQKNKAVLMATATAQDKKNLEAHFDILSPRYLLYAPAATISDHLAMFNTLGDRAFVWQVEKDGNTNTRTVTICAKDRPGLFSKIAGVFTVNGLDILNAEVYTWRNSIAMDIFTLRPPADLIFEKERWARAEKQLHQALKNEINLEEIIGRKFDAHTLAAPKIRKQPLRVKIDNDSSSFFTIVEIFSDDYPGLLFRVTDALYKLDLDIRVAKIATKVDQVVDVLYVRDLLGQKVDAPERVTAIREMVESVLSETNSQQERIKAG